jgi:predicted amidohydrolase YtcJ
MHERLTITDVRIADFGTNNGGAAARPDELRDIVIESGNIAAMHPSRGCDANNAKNGEVLDGDGATALSGLHDHHIHLMALAASRNSLDCGPDAVTTRGAFEDRLRRAAKDRAAHETDRWIRGVGYFESVAGPLNRDILDAVEADVPVRIQHRSGVAWFCNSVALRALTISETSTGTEPIGIDRDERGRPTGVLYRLDRWLSDRVPRRPLDLAMIGQELASYGVTALTDATPTRSADEYTPLLEAHANDRLPQRLQVMTGSPNASCVGPLSAVKILLDEANPLDLDALSNLIAASHVAGLPVAIHLTDRSMTWLALAAWSDVGARPGDRIEHGAVLDNDAVERVASLGLIVVTNPALAAIRGDDHARDTASADRDHLWRCGSLMDAGIAVRGGTDAPYGPPDPWRSIAAAITRRTPKGGPIGTDRPLQPLDALGLFATTPRRPLRVGDPADLCLLTGTLDDVLAQVTTSPGHNPVLATVIAGRIVHAAS